ncbi:MAG: nucleoside deaminase [Prevotella sp.]|nr:nucleoside deaminase [Prevotella sp.]
MENVKKTANNDNQPQHDERFMRMALAEARKAYDKGEVPIGAVVVCRNQVVARAYNLTETLTDVTAHAEMQAITMAASELGGKYLTECTLYVTVEPCTMCAGALGWAQVARIVYGCRDEKRGYTVYAPHALHPKTTVTAGILEDDCRQLMQAFFRSKR